MNSSGSLTSGEYSVLVEQAPIMIWRAGLDAKCDYFNERWLAFTGRTMDEERGDGWAQGVHPDDLPRCLDIYLTSFAARRVFEMEYRLERNDGVYRWIFDRGVPFFDSNDEFAGFIGSCIDISESVEAREHLKKTREAELQALRGMLPICAWCKQVKNDAGYWEAVEVYIRNHSNVDFSHGVCPNCARKFTEQI